jgi:hypothetical protein
LPKKLLLGSSLAQRLAVLLASSKKRLRLVEAEVVLPQNLSVSAVPVLRLER